MSTKDTKNIRFKTTDTLKEAMHLCTRMYMFVCRKLTGVKRSQFASSPSHSVFATCGFNYKIRLLAVFVPSTLRAPLRGLPTGSQMKSNYVILN